MTGRSMETPATWLEQHAPLLPGTGRALDVACGRGRNALWLAARGLTVDAVDRDADAMAALQTAARDRGLAVQARVADLESGTPDISAAAFDVIVVTHYLHRPLFPVLVAALTPGGLLVYETFTRAQALRGKPSNPAFLLEPGELRRLVQPLEILAEREGEFDNRDIASVVARK
jgi:SAM-dependent methyltransferase